MEVLKDTSALHNFRQNVEKFAFVPTMGALHEGHLSLIQEGLKHCDTVLVSIFVNPTQFAPHEDFESYPRTVADDIKKLEDIGVQAVWLPKTEDMYPDGVVSDVHITGVADPLESEFRPHFFDGVATVVARLLRAVEPDVALFGEKDFQQLQVIKKMVRQENIGVKIIGVPIKRDENGLALSSRNAYLSESEYKVAIQLNKILEEFSEQKMDESQAHQKLIEAGFDKIDYCSARNAETLGEENPSRVLVAVWIGKTRLIDNMAMN